jgi:type VI secretion system protein ImpG
VYEVLRVTGYGTQAELTREFFPFYLARDRGDLSSQAYYVTNRVARLQSEHDRLRGPRSGSYSGSEVYLSVVDTAAAPYSPDIKQLGVETLCTNRDLPLHLSIGQGGSDFTMDKAVPCSGIYCLGPVTSPKASPTAGGITWRAINHLSLNYLSLAETDNGSGVSALRDILGLYANVGDLQISKQIDGIKAVQCKPITRRIRMSGSIAFARGLEVKVTLEEAMFAGSGVFLMGAVLEQFFARYVSINSFTETVIETVERGEIMRWPMRTGLRQIL